MFSKSSLDLSDEEILVAEFKRGSTVAFERIFMKFHGAITYFCLKFILDEDGAKDVASELFMKVWNMKDDFENLRAIKAFLYTSARNACLNYLRRENMVRTNSKKMAFGQTEAVDDPSMMLIFNSEVLREVYQEINSLPKQCKRVIKLALQGLPTEDIATAMGLSEQTVRNTRVRGIQILKDKLANNSVAVVTIMAMFEMAHSVKA